VDLYLRVVVPARERGEEDTARSISPEIAIALLGRGSVEYLRCTSFREPRQRIIGNAPSAAGKYQKPTAQSMVFPEVVSHAGADDEHVSIIPSKEAPP
jgi:hypothetical protein